MRRCRTCKKKLQKDEKKYCRACLEFHLYNYSEDELEIIEQKYERSHNK
jgi:hypothetical protein